MPEQGRRTNPIQELAEKEISNFGNTTHAIKECFSTVTNELSGLDAFGFKVDGQPAMLSEHWKVLSDRFEESLRQGRYLTAEATFVLHTHSKAILDEVHKGENVEEVKAELLELENQMKTKQEESKDRRRSFEHLSTDLREFGHRLESAMRITDFDAPQGVTNQVVKLCNILSDIIKDQVQSLARKTETVAVIWALLRSDMVELKTHLAMAVHHQGKADEEFIEEMQYTRETYLHLAHMLDLSAKGH
ncbi:uncharacterized protein BXZ73DRAFT_82577 [Epithele typhae]|uniref:uncharacterized protein n=1 Tax=Epithele typhae TaxID=378194 RepID=UPI002007C731|nr:uncharacterized protein BXZ73DRAFT_82577 [Epithele typhae]KAH9911926.1 hypothetical protein BXZ73DRAFT_82577 [Epithele typhae]